MEAIMNFLRKARTHFNSRVFTSMLKSIIIVLAIPIVINILVAAVSLASIQQEMERYERSMLTKAEDEVERAYTDAFQIMNWIRNNEMVINYTKSDQRNYYTEFQLSRLIGDVTASYSIMEMVYLYFPESDYVISSLSSGESRYFCSASYRTSYEEWQELMDAEWRGKRGILEGKNGSRKNVIVSSVLGGQLYSGKAILVIQLDTDKLEKKLSGLKLNQEDEMIVYSQDTIIYSTVFEADSVKKLQISGIENGLRTLRLNGERYKIREYSGENGLRILYLENRRRSNSVILFNGIFVGVTVGIYVLLSFVLSFFITKKNFMPIQKIFSLYKEEGQENWLNDYETMEYYVRNQIFRSKHMSNTLKLYENDLKTVYLERMLHGKILYLDSIKEGAAMYDLQFAEGYNIVILYIMNTAEEEEDNGLTKRELLNELIKEYIVSARQYYLLEEEDCFVAVLNGLAESAAVFYTRFEEENRAMIHDAEKAEEFSFECFVSAPFERLDEMHNAYMQVCASRRKQEEPQTAGEVEEKQCNIERILDLIRENIQDVNLSGAVIADTFHVTQSHLSRYFKQQMGVGVLDYIHKYRISLAKDMMKENLNVRIKEVAERTGFYNVSALIRVFKKNEGMTPGEYRDSL